MRHVVVVTGILVAMTVGAVMAIATPGAGVSGPILSRGTVAQGLVVGHPVTKTVTKKVKVRVRGRTYTRRVRLRVHTVDPIIACNRATPCDTAVQQVTITPGGHTGWHTHPGATFVTIAQGEGKLYHAGPAGSACRNERFPAGQGFFQTERENHVLRNEASVNLVAHAFYVMPRGTQNAAIRTDQPQPANCPAIP